MFPSFQIQMVEKERGEIEKKIGKEKKNLRILSIVMFCNINTQILFCFIGTTIPKPIHTSTYDAALHHFSTFSHFTFRRRKKKGFF